MLQHILQPQHGALDLRQFADEGDQAIDLRLEAGGHLLGRQQHAQGELAAQHQQEAHHQHPQADDLTQQAGQEPQGGLAQPQAMAEGLHPGAIAGITLPDIGLRGGATYHLDLAQGAHRGRLRLARILLELLGGIALQPQVEAHQGGIEAGAHHHHHSQQGAVGQGQQQIQHQQHQADRHRQQPLGDEVGQLPVQQHPLADVAGVTLLEEPLRHGQHVLFERTGPPTLQPPGQQPTAQQLQLAAHGLQQDRQGHHPEQRFEPVTQPRSPHLIHVDLAEHRHGQLGQDQQQSRQQAEQHRPGVLPQALQHQGPEGGRPAAAAESRRRPQLQHHTGEAGIKHLLAHPAGAGGGVVEGHPPAAEAFEHHEVIELPEQDHRQPPLAQVLHLHAIALARQAVEGGGAQQAGGIAAIAADAALLAQLQQGHVAAMVAQQDRQAGGPAFGGLHLQHGGGADPAHLSRSRSGRAAGESRS